LLTRPPSSTPCPYTPLFRSLRQQAEDAQRRVAEHLEAARQAQEEADRARRLAGFAPDELREAEEPEAPFSMEELVRRVEALEAQDRKSTRLNSSHVKISYAV